MNQRFLWSTFRQFGMAVFMLTLWIAPFRAQSAATFIDLTAKEYKGADSDLSGLGFSKFGVGCDENGTYRVGDASGVSWADYSGQGNKSLINYSIHFRVRNRNGNVIHEEDFVYNRLGSQGEWPFRGHVVWSDPSEACGGGRSSVIFKKTVDLSFATIEYWVSKIKWREIPVSNLDGQYDKVAFSVDKRNGSRANQPTTKTNGEVDETQKEKSALPNAEPLPIPLDIKLVTEMPELAQEAIVPYPPNAKDRGVEGAVTMALLIDSEGNVRKADVIDGSDPELNSAALKSALGFKFKPARQKKKPVSVIIHYVYRFVLAN